MPISTLKGGNVPIKLWANVSEVESQALDQLRNIAKLPWVFHEGVAVMPDVHLGKGATVGSVIAMKGAVSPAAVGVDIGCVDMDSEFLSPAGWKRIADWNGERVMQFDPETGDGRFVEPDAYIKRPSNGFIHFKTKYGVDMALSDDHKVLYYKYDRSYTFSRYATISAGEMATIHADRKLGFRHRFNTTFTPVLDSECPFTDDELRVIIMGAADGSITRQKMALHFRKDRKIERAFELLGAAGIGFNHTEHADGAHRISYSPPVFDKSLEMMWGASLRQLRVVCDEVMKWDGNEEEGSFCTRHKPSADFIHYAFAACGYRSVLRTDTHYRDGKLDYRVYANTNTKVGIAGTPKTEMTRIPSPDGFEYCFTVPSGFWVMRRNGNIVMTGNCGMGAVKTNLRAEHLPDSLKAIRSQIERDIPVGFNEHSSPADLRRTGDALEAQAIKQDTKALFDEFKDLTTEVQDRMGKAGRQLGTLGGGNHFIELCLDTEGNVWMMLHSGSRNIGKELAEIHIARAKGLAHNQDLPDRDLAAFLAGTPEMEAYRRDLFWAQRYAFLNRRVMFSLYKGALRRFFPDIEFGDAILCHHNYVSEETHFGEDLVVTRKGAIAAHEGTMGIIPGSMGAKSFIVRGRGNPESYCSASHGAGRRHSRSKAKKLFTMEDFERETTGVECRKDQGVLDEIPSAYKDIEQVMANQADLVEVVAELKQVLCVKG